MLGQEIRPAEFVDDRVDLLAIDPEGAAVIIELKRGANKLQLLQALSYAAMIAKWSGDKLLSQYSKSGKHTADAKEELEQFLDEDISTLNHSQRVILLAEDFDYEVLVAAEWLTERYELDIRCYRLALSTEAGKDFLTCNCIYPPRELTDVAKSPGGGPKYPDWPTALSELENPAVLEFFQHEIAGSREKNLRDRSIRWRFDGKRRFRARARRKYAVVRQYGRFENDEKFWTDSLGPDIKLRELDHGYSLRFLVQSKEQFAKLTPAIEGLRQTTFVQPHGSGGDEEGDAEE